MRFHAVWPAAALALVVFVAPSAARSDGRSSAATDEAGQAHIHAQAAIATMAERATLLMRMLREARAERRPRPEVSCVDEALTRADVAVRRAREDADRAAVAYERGDLLEARAAVAAIDARDRLSRAALADARVCMRE
jgi:hypothetical protein